MSNVKEGSSISKTSGNVWVVVTLEDGTYYVDVHLDGSQRGDAAVFGDLDAAKAHADAQIRLHGGDAAAPWR